MRKTDDGSKVTFAYSEKARFKPCSADPKKPPPTTLPKVEVFQRLSGDRVPYKEMESMGTLNQAEVLDNVHCLFQHSQTDKPQDGTVIYSSVGPVLISMNPFKTLPIYGPEWMKAFSKCNGDKVSLRKLGPHAYRTADDAFTGLKKQVEKDAPVKNQAMVICGESGAGKTYTCRHMLNYLCEVSKPSAGGAVADPAAITSANELLESFGNATTTRNDNSSRFGKLTELYFEPGAKMEVCSCEVKHYLIERSRIMGAPDLERNYHIFYQMVRSGEHAKFKLTDKADDYAAIKNGGGIKQPGIYESDDKSDYAGLITRMKAAKFETGQIEDMFKAMSVVLHMSNVAVTGSQDSSGVDSKQPGMVVGCEFLGVDPGQLSTAVCQKFLQLPGKGKVEQKLSKVKASAQLETTAKMVYSRTFDSIVAQITKSLKGKETKNTIGLLDIFGFEDMQVNGFEQMFINLTNERIQQLFNEIMFEREKQVYRDDGLSCDFLKAPDNKECVKMFLGKGGIVPLLNEACTMKLEDEAVDGDHFVSKMGRQFGKNHKYYKYAEPTAINKLCKAKGIVDPSNPRVPGLKFEECFSVLHYAGVVTYTVKDFVPKSRDSLETHVTEMLQKSKVPFIAQMFSPEVEAASSGGTVGTKFGHQLTDLANLLGSGETLFVRCIKSNPGKQQIPVLDRQSVFEQLTRGGVIAALEIRAAGLPDQILYEDFVGEFSLLEIGKADDLSKIGNDKRAAKIINDIIGKEAIAKDQVKLGKTKVFMKSGVVSRLRAASRFKEHLYARRVQTLLGSSRVRKIDNLWGLIIAQEEKAKEYNFLKYEAITTAIEIAKTKVKPMVDKLTAAKAKHGEKNYEKLQEEMEQYMGEIKDLRPLVDKVKEAVMKMDQKRQKFQNIFDQRIGNGIQNCADFEKRVEAVEKDAAEMDGVADAKADVDKCKASCAQARSKLEELRTKVLPDLQKGGFENIDLDKQAEDPCPKVTQLLDAVAKLVGDAEKLGFEVLKTKREFMKVIEELGAAKDAAMAKLESLDNDAGRLAAEGMHEFTADIKKAADLAFSLESILEKGKDPEAFKTCFVKFQEQVDVAHKKVQEGLVELERREKEREERNQIDENLAVARSDAQACLKALQIAVLEGKESSQQSLDTMVREVTKLQVDGPKMALDKLRPEADAKEKEVHQLTEEINAKIKVTKDEIAVRVANARAMFK